jgi:dolichol-phosphate mannosyltransferase
MTDSVPALLAALNRGDTDFVIGTRYGEGVAIDASWPLHRRVISKGARLLGAALTPLRYSSDRWCGIRGNQIAHQTIAQCCFDYSSC